MKVSSNMLPRRPCPTVGWRGFGNQAGRHRMDPARRETLARRLPDPNGMSHIAFSEEQYPALMPGRFVKRDPGQQP